MIKLCVFDVDGTLMDTLSSIAYHVNTMLEKMNFPTIPTDEFNYMAGNGRTVLVERALKYVGEYSKENMETACKIYDSAYEACPMYLTKPFDGIIEEVKKIKEMGIKVAVLSNKPDNVVRFVIEDEKTFGKNFFDYVRGGLDSEPLKPDPKLFIEMADKFGIDPCNACMIGDTNVDIQTGVNAKAKTIGVLWGFRDRQELEGAGADCVISKVGEISEAVASL